MNPRPLELASLLLALSIAPLATAGGQLGASIAPAGESGQATKDVVGTAEAGGTQAGAATVGAKAGTATLEARRALLETAFEIASTIPTQGYARDRARMQAVAAEAFIAIGVPDRAAMLDTSIDGWRRGEVWAATALDSAKAGRADEARMLAKRALGVVPSVLDWQRERINVSVARVYAWLGDDGEAAKLEKGGGETEMGRVAAARAGKTAGANAAADGGEVFSKEYFETQMAALDEWIKTKNFDLVRNSMDIAFEFYPNCLADPARRTRLETLMAAANDQLAYDLRIANLTRMADILSARGELPAARAAIEKAETVLKSNKWLTEDAVQQAARIAGAKARAGEREAARKDLEAALVRYDEGRAGIVDIYRARPLRAVAETFALLEDAAQARTVYLRALEDGSTNPNARPRAEEVTATLVSMAKSGIGADEAITAKVAAIRAGLVGPW
jgi:tetratricopeptide (TPR) repeat protein